MKARSLLPADSRYGRADDGVAGDGRGAEAEEEKEEPVAAGRSGKAAKAASSDSFLSKLGAFPIELWIIGVAVVLAVVGAASSSASGFAIMGLVVIGVGCMFWGQICIVMAAFAEGTITGSCTCSCRFIG